MFFDNNQNLNMIIGKITNGTRKKQSWDDVSNNEI